MRASTVILGVVLVAFAAGLPTGTQGAPQNAVAVSANTSPPKPTAQKERASADAEFSLAEGEKRFRQNCGRCHVAPDKYPPRVMATALRHMRVRATITNEDAKLILWYMTR